MGLRICGQVERGAAAMHERGIVFNDLHMFNIMVQPDETVLTFIDFEAASDVNEDPHRRATPGSPRPGPDEDDINRAACLRRAPFLPLTTLFNDEDKRHRSRRIAGCSCP